MEPKVEDQEENVMDVGGTTDEAKTERDGRRNSTEDITMEGMREVQNNHINEYCRGEAGGRRPQIGSREEDDYWKKTRNGIKQGRSRG